MNIEGLKNFFNVRMVVDALAKKFGLAYSSVSQRVSVIKEVLNKDKELERKHRHIKSLIKI
jgi:hypothetical protein